MIIAPWRKGRRGAMVEQVSYHGQRRRGLLYDRRGMVLVPGLMIRPSGAFVPDFFVSTTGGGAGHAGTIGDPFSLSFALSGAGGLITAGKKVGIQAGTYDAGNASWTLSVSGTAGNEIWFRNYNNGAVRIINTSAGAKDVLKFNANYAYLWGCELYDNGWTNRNIATQTNGCVTIGNTFGNGGKLIHCIIHDGEQGLQNITGACNSDRFETYGCIFYNAGVDVSPLGHNFYIHHTGSTTARWVLEENIIFNTFGLLAQVYGNTDDVSWFDLIGNIFFGGGGLSASSHYGSQMVLMGGGAQPPINCRYLQNMLFGDDLNSRTLEVGFSAGNINTVEVGNNYHVGGGQGIASMDIFRPVVPASSLNVHDNFFQVKSSKLLFRINDADPPGYTWSTNEWRHVSTSGFDGQSFSAWKTSSQMGGTDTQFDADPTLTKVFVRATTRYESGRGHVCYYNWAGLSQIPVDLSPILNVNDTYAIYDARDAHVDSTPILTGTYAGGTVNFPNTQVADPAPIGGFVASTDPNDTAPTFNAFVVKKT